MTNALYYGDDLDILRQHVADESVYLDPPFNSNANYNVLFKEQSGEAELLEGREFEIPQHRSMYQHAQRVHRPEGRQTTMPDAV